MPPYDLWITARCAEDDLQVAWPQEGGPSTLNDDVVNRFLHLRTDDPEPPADKISSIRHRTCYGLRFHDRRGATWYDEPSGCVFLIAAGLRRDIYEELLSLDARGELFPDDHDYEDLQFYRAGQWLRELRDDYGPELVDAARAEPEVPHVQELGRVDVTMVAYPISTGGTVLHMLVETHEPMAFSQVEVIAETVVGHLGATVEPVHHFLQRPINGYDAFAFYALIE